MGTEIERKFLVNRKPLDEACREVHQITQNYLATGNEEVRIRKKIIEGREDDYTLCIKRGSGLARIEETIEITADTYRQLEKTTRTEPIEKVRSIYAMANYVIELDCYNHLDLMVAEVEFISIDEAQRFEPPYWFGTEVTADDSYKNQSLWKMINRESRK